MTTLITGGAGFIGSRLALRLLAEGERVIVLDDFNDYYDPAIKRGNVAAMVGDVQIIEGDIRDDLLIDQLFNDEPIERVAHMAAMANVRYSTERGRQYAEVNTSASVSLMDAARRHGVAQFVLGSTSSVYGNTDRIPFVEDDAAMTPLAPYPASKRAAEIFAHSYHHLFGLNVTSLRFFNVYGPHGRPDMMPMRVIDSILKGETITLFGDGLLQRDWTYIDDIIAGVRAALYRPLGYALINLGFGAPITLIEFIHIYENLIGKSAITHSVPAPATEPQITYCDNTRARQLLDFSPQTPVQDGLAQTWTWYRSRFGV